MKNDLIDAAFWIHLKQRFMEDDDPTLWRLALLDTTTLLTGGPKNGGGSISPSLETPLTGRIRLRCRTFP